MKTKEGFDFSNAKRGPIIPQTRKTERLIFRIDADIIAWFREYVENAGGGDYEQMMNDALREYVEKRRQSLKDISLNEKLRAVG
ncbi:MAG: BrnA antitoxin family protein [Magnetococcales bacterium]|nr:BrnA antitoxin family protein [Magnetococcales bacterium]